MAVLQTIDKEFVGNEGSHKIFTEYQKFVLESRLINVPFLLLVWELGEPAHAGAAVERRVPPVHHPPQRPRRHRQHHWSALQGRGKCG